jgi:hypothetical protein
MGSWCASPSEPSVTGTGGEMVLDSAVASCDLRRPEILGSSEEYMDDAELD